MINIEEICQNINSRIHRPAQGYMRIPIYRFKIKIWIINFLRLFFRHQVYDIAIANPFPKISKIQFWKVISPDKWEEIDEKFIAIPKYCIENECFWRIFLHRSSFLQDLTYGTNPPLESFGGGLTAFIVEKKTGKLYHLMNNHSDYEGDYAAADFERHLKNEACELDWEQLKIPEEGNIEPLRYTYPPREVLEMDFTYSFLKALTKEEQDRITDDFILFFELQHIFLTGEIDAMQMKGSLNYTASKIPLEDVLQLLKDFRQSHQAYIEALKLP